MIATPDNNDIRDVLAEENPEAMLADGFDDALIGITANYHHAVVAVYDLDLCVDILISQGMTADEAQEYLSYNTLGAYIGQNGPLFIRTH